ncbi:MAG: MFS transporter, partial [Alphaproteobacteria bacterium]
MNRTILAAQMVYSMGITLFLATYVLWLQKVGLRLDEIAFVDIIFNLGILVFEVPTGVIADRFGRRVSFILSCIVRGTALIGLAFGVTFPMIAALMFLAAIGETMASGASESWLISNLRKDVRVRDVYRTLALIDGITSIIGGTIGAALYAVSPAMMWTASGAMLAVAAVIAAFAPEGPKDAQGDITGPTSRARSASCADHCHQCLRDGRGRAVLATCGHRRSDRLGGGL